MPGSTDRKNSRQNGTRFKIWVNGTVSTYRQNDQQRNNDNEPVEQMHGKGNGVNQRTAHISARLAKKSRCMR